MKYECKEYKEDVREGYDKPFSVRVVDSFDKGIERLLRMIVGPFIKPLKK